MLGAAERVEAFSGLMSFLTAMRLPLALGASTLALLLGTAGPAAAQMYPGEDVIVNPNAVGSPYYPGGLLPPGAQSRHLPPVHLHPPKTRHRTRSAPKRRHPVARREPAPAASEPRTASAPPPSAKAAPSPKAAPARRATADIPFSLEQAAQPGGAARAQAPARPEKRGRDTAAQGGGLGPAPAQDHAQEGPQQAGRGAVRFRFVGTVRYQHGTAQRSGLQPQDGAGQWRRPCRADRLCRPARRQIVGCAAPQPEARAEPCARR